jgi:Holliday junction resolvase
MLVDPGGVCVMSNATKREHPAYKVSSASKRGRSSRNKGKRGEREAAKALAKVLGCTARRGQQFAGGNDSPDLITSIAGVHFEVKRTESLSLYKAIDQAQTDCKPNDVPVVLHRRNHQPWLVVVELERLPELIEAIGEV